MTIERINDRGFLSDVVASGEWVWIAGTVSDPTKASIEDQTRDVLAQIDQRLAAVGARKDQLLSVSVWLADIEDWAAMNGVWSEWLGETPSPARAVVGASLVRPFLIEIAATACRDRP